MHLVESLDIQIVVNLIKTSNGSQALVEFPTMPGKFYRMTYEESIDDFTDYTINRVSKFNYFTIVL